MKAIDHILLGYYFAMKYGLERGEKTVFLLGSIAPDLNPFTYLTASRNHLLRGHSYTFKKKKMAKLFDGGRKHTLFWWYRVGRMCHYLTDSFTAAHDEKRKMSLPSHKAYEHSLHRRFPQILHIHIRRSSRKKPAFPEKPSTRIAALRKQYEAAEQSVETDGYMILAAVESVLDVLTAPAETQKKIRRSCIFPRAEAHTIPTRIKKR
ncbi:MAG: hypothetical protein E7658_01930 [Ruminococcaceae bacterium]|nr:hypothetical protein [Oscillospiraceae bacterium]